MAFGIGKDKGKTSQSNQTYIDPTQQVALNQAWRQGQNVLTRIQPRLNDASQQYGREAQDINRELTGRQRQIAGGSNPFIRNLLQRTGGDNPFLQEQVNALGTDINRFTQEALQGVGQGFAGANQYGSGRQGLAEGVAIGRGAEEFAQGAANLRADDLVNQQQAAQAGAGLQLAASQAGQEGAARTFELGIAPLLAQFGGAQALAEILGNPTVLGEGQSSGKTSGSSFDFTG